ncbi:MAG: hypothetical protein L3J18_17470 [Candidatus Brocadia sp.]|nr:MAG: hypothetical protein L3J18_17470 [Candidatus Brocadia sp.]
MRFTERDATMLAGLGFVMNGLRDMAWQGHDTGFTRMTFLAARLSAGSATSGCTAFLKGVIL